MKPALQPSKLRLLALAILTLIAALSACTTTEPDVIVMLNPTATLTPSDAFTWGKYISADQAFQINVPADWIVDENVTENGVDFVIAPLREFIESKPDFNQAVGLVYGGTFQTIEENATLDNLEVFHRQAFYENSLFTLEQQTELSRIDAGNGVTYMISDATSTQEDGSMVYWKFGTAIVDRTVVNFAIAVSVTGGEEYGPILLDIFNSVGINITATASLAE